MAPTPNYSASSVYGAGPVHGQSDVAASRMAGGGGMRSATVTAISARTATATRTGLAADPTAWLVALVGASAFLAIWST